MEYASTYVRDTQCISHINAQKIYISNESKRIQSKAVKLLPYLRYIKKLERILEYEVKQLRNRERSFVKLLQKHGTERYVTCEKEAEMKTQYPYLFN